MLYKPHGPFKVPRKKVKAGYRALDFSAPALRKFWEEVDAARIKLSKAKGCYIFAIRAGRGIRPWYVGQTGGSFYGECFQSTKRDHYREALSHNSSGTPVIFLLARCTPRGALSNRVPLPGELDFVEKMLISHALEQNSELRNVRDTRYLRNLTLPGVLNTPAGGPARTVQDLKVALGL